MRSSLVEWMSFHYDVFFCVILNIVNDVLYDMTVSVFSQSRLIFDGTQISQHDKHSSSGCHYIAVPTSYSIYRVFTEVLVLWR